MKNSGKADIPITDESGLETLLQDSDLIGVETPYGRLSLISIGDAGGKSVVFFPSHDVQQFGHLQRLDCRCACLILQQVLREAIEHLPQNYKCPCENVLKNASFEVK
ncbi:MAG: hypothetical protein JSW19_03745 [Candidatus Bathyarchaeota archaeon]|nr:MAG: hypothetical protein JSV75_03980 [Candidatus Bathyarchaeota archaeon]UCE57477.1 MAG: hypothetical protein JSW19_03745 [Candidatus Bathyarchaeota archaeon]